MTISIVIGGEKFPFDGWIRYEIPNKRYEGMILSAFRVPGEILPSRIIAERCTTYQRSIYTLRRHIKTMTENGLLEQVRIVERHTSIIAYRRKK